MHEFTRDNARPARPRGGMILAAAAVAALAAAHRSDAGETGTEITISLSGSTAMSNFTRSAAISLVTPGNQLSIGGVLYPSSPNYWPTNGAGVSFQLAPGTYPGTSSSAQFGAADALRLEWHEQGSVEGILEMVNDQIAPVASIGASNRNPTSANAVWVNTNKFTAAAGNLGGHPLGQMYSTPGATGGQPNFERGGRNPN